MQLVPFSVELLTLSWTEDSLIPLLLKLLERGGKGERVEGEKETGNMKTQVEFLLRCCVSVVLHDGE